MTHREFSMGQFPVDTSVRSPDGTVLAVVTRPLRYALRMVVFLAVVGIVTALLHEHAARFFLRNPPLNALILSVLALGIGLSFRAVLSLDPEVNWIQRFRQGDPSVLVGASPPLLGPLAALLRDPKRHLSLSATGMRNVLDGVDSRLAERRETSRYLIALLIFLGLLGTFWGLLLTANSVGDTIRGLRVVGSDPAEMFETLRAGLEAPLSGMGTAFSTSLFGLASSLVLGFLDLQASQAQNRFANELENWLTGLTHSDGGAVWGEEGPAPSYLTALLERTVESLDELQRRMARGVEASSSVNAAVLALGERLASLTDELRAKNGVVESAADAQIETRGLLKRIAGTLEAQGGGLDDATRMHLRNIDRAVARLVEDEAQGRERAIAEVRSEIRLLARTLSVIADRER
jgi:membrane associated rhomboid family serine protease